MGARRLPGAKELAAHLKKMTMQEVADRYGVTQQAVSAAAHRWGIIESTPVREDPLRTKWIPPEWVVRTEHNHDKLYEALRWAVRIEKGLPLPPFKVKRVDTLKDTLDREKVAVAYSRDRGFVLIPRQRGEKYVTAREP